MNKQKLNYLAPEAETLVIRFEGAVCVSDPNRVRSNSASSGYDDENILDELSTEPNNPLLLLE